jgi:farnesyl-diphosphate farnesyltransferase
MALRIDVSRLLRKHARTFALTLRILPQALRGPLGIAYLLARASDTIADAPGIPRERRLIMLEQLDAALAADKPHEWRPEIASGEITGDEECLLAALPVLLEACGDPEGKGVILRLWRTILQGQLFDLRRFGPAAAPLSPEELEFYCGLVAGSVGAAWTGLIDRHSPEALMRSAEEMIPLGIAYGKGLQLVNILRDRAEDRALGRCYVREEDLPEIFGRAEACLRSGELYLAGLRPGQILMASSLPLNLALPTLHLIKEQPGIARVKLPRRRVRGILLRSTSSLWLPRPGDPAS